MCNTLDFDIQFYNSDHRKKLQSNCSAFPAIKKLVSTGLTINKEELFSYAIFVEQKPGMPGWQTYQDLQDKLPDFRGAWERNFTFAGDTVHAAFDRGVIRNCHTEAIGVAGAMAVANRVYGLTAAGWETIDRSQIKYLDFMIGSTGSKLIQVEAKGSVVPDHKQSHISDRKKSIEDKKEAQRSGQDNRNTMLGVITAIPEPKAINVKARCWVLDPPADTIPGDPLRHKLLSRLYFYWRELSLVSRSHLLRILINRIRSIQAVSDWKALDRTCLLNFRGEPLPLPESLFLNRSSIDERSGFGEVLPLPNMPGKFFFYGFDAAVVRALLEQDFATITEMRFDSRVERDVKMVARIPRRLIKSHDGEERVTEYEEKSRHSLHMKGDLTHTQAGRILGFVEPME